MKEKSRLKLKMILSLCMCVLSLFSIVTLTFTWFAMNNKAQGNGMGVIIKDDSFITGFEYYVAKREGNGYKFEAKSGNEADLGAYDLVNDKYQLLIKVNIVSAMNVEIIAETATNYFLGNINATGTDKHELTADGTGNALSSVVSFYVFNRETTATDGSALISATQDGYELKELPAGTKTFIDKTAVDAATAPTPQLTLTETNGLEVTADGNGKAYFFILLSYDPLLMSTVFAVNIGNPVLQMTDENHSIPFEPDFKLGVNRLTA